MSLLAVVPIMTHTAVTPGRSVSRRESSMRATESWYSLGLMIVWSMGTSLFTPDEHMVYQST